MQYPPADSTKALIYLYDMPAKLVTSVKIAQIIKNASGYDLSEPVQFKECKPHPVTGLQSNLNYGIIKVDPAQKDHVAKAIKYFDIDDGVDTATGKPRIWHCRALPFDRELLGANKNATNSQLNVFVKNIGEDVVTAELDKKFSELFGDVKSAKISLSQKTKKDDVAAPPTSNGYGFVCFQTQAAHDQAIAKKVIDGMEINSFQPRDNREIRKIFNNVYVKNFDASWTEADLKPLFAKYGNIKSLVVMHKPDKTGEQKAFAFVCYEDANDKSYGPIAASKAVEDLHDREFNGQKIYVQPALPQDQRKAQVIRDQQRFKNSKKKCNLFIKGFPVTFTEEQIRQLFSPYGEIESIKIIASKEESAGGPRSFGSRAFVCFKQPDSAANARAHLHQYVIEGKPLYVTNYELPEIRKKQQNEAKDRADFMTRRSVSAPLDSAVLNRPDTIHLIQQILSLIQKQMGGRGPMQQQYNRGPQQQRMGGQRPGGFQNRQPGQQRPPYPQQQPLAAPLPVQQPIPQVTAQPAQFAIKGDLQPLAHPDPFVNAYNQKGFTLLPVVVPNNPNLKQFVGEFIYEYVEKIVGEDKAPKITGMLIDLPLDEIKGYLYDFGRLNQKVMEAIQILTQHQ